MDGLTTGNKKKKNASPRIVGVEDANGNLHVTVPAELINGPPKDLLERSRQEFKRLLNDGTDYVADGEVLRRVLT